MCSQSYTINFSNLLWSQRQQNPVMEATTKITTSGKKKKKKGIKYAVKFDK